MLRERGGHYSIGSYLPYYLILLSTANANTFFCIFYDFAILLVGFQTEIFKAVDGLLDLLQIRLDRILHVPNHAV